MSSTQIVGRAQGEEPLARDVFHVKHVAARARGRAVHDDRVAAGRGSVGHQEGRQMFYVKHTSRTAVAWVAGDTHSSGLSRALQAREAYGRCFT